MNIASRTVIRVRGMGMLLMLVAVLMLLVPVWTAAKAAAGDSDGKIWQWDSQWSPGGEWFRSATGDPLPIRPEDADTLTIRLRLPDTLDRGAALSIEEIIGNEIRIYKRGELVVESNRPFGRQAGQVLLPLHASDAGEEIEVRIAGLTAKAGIGGEVRIGSHQALLGDYAVKHLDDLVQSGAFLFAGAAMLVCLPFLPRNHRGRWAALSVILICIGVVVITYSPILYTLLGEYDRIYTIVFDTALFILLPMLSFFIEKSLEGGAVSRIRRLRLFQTGYSLLVGGALVYQVVTDFRQYEWYYFLSVTCLGVIVLGQMLLLTGEVLWEARRRQGEAVLISVGFGILAFVLAAELILFYTTSGMYELVWWKWGVIAFALSLLIAFGRRMTEDHKRIVKYTKELELFNTHLQKHEKMEIISDLTASVAHEVRNPLQVTRGFLQLLRQKSAQRETEYADLAMAELDRASTIITDFLTFAKPQLDEITRLNLADVLKHVEGILTPLANLQGGRLIVKTPEELMMHGSEAKLKQVFINIVKNGIESLDGEGDVRIWAYKRGRDLYVHVKDDGIGMDDAELKRLGEPHVSVEKKGAGLGLMVTFRIIEVMGGTIAYNSKKGVGTEAIIRFPAAGDAPQSKP